MGKKQLLEKRIREIRKREGLSQEKLAERASISAQYVSNIERGKENPTLDLLLALADALDVSLSEMCDFEDLDQRKMQNAIREILKVKEPVRLRTALKILKVVFQ